MKELKFEEHVEEIIKDLELDNNIKVYVGKCAIEYVKNNDEVYCKKHKKSLKSYFRSCNGLYLWWENENIVLVKRKKYIGTLAHELRHAWQYKNRKEKGFDFSRSVKERYLISKKEIDANEYARDYCKKKSLFKTAKKYSCKVKRIYFLKHIFKHE